ncbi:DUF1634 domain-containing protein [Candidatus Bathyarchaeota archaeon]|nr:DUF1634 domain-containing protein [Candidatus Bathyarchaeota archaeon]
MKLELVLSSILKICTIISIGLIMLGITLLFVKGDSLGYPIDILIDPYTPVNTGALDYSMLYKGLIMLEGLSIIMLGLIVMVATPVLRIILGILVLIFEEDRICLAVAITTLILILLAILLVPRIV